MINIFSAALFLLVCLTAHAQVGKVGINTSSPQAMLHVKDSSVLFSASTLPAIPGKPPLTGIGIRMMWYSDKAAFRSGYVDGVNWDKDSTGGYSFATGYDTKAKGEVSVASGFRTNATGGFSFASGFITSAEAPRSAAFGNNTISRFSDGMVLGAFNDTSSFVPFSQVYSPSLFAVGNGTAGNNRRNAFTVTANGRVGIGTTNPQAALQIFNQNSLDQHIALNSLFSSIDTAYIKFDDRRMQFRNTSNAGSFWDFQNKAGVTQCMIGSNGDVDIKGGWTTGRACGINTTDPTGSALHIFNRNALDYHLALTSVLSSFDTAYIKFDDRRMQFRNTSNAGSSWDFQNKAGVTQCIIGSNGDVDIKGGFTMGPNRSLGVNTSSPFAPLHVINNAASGGSFNSKASVIMEDNDHAYFQFSNPNNREAGLLSGNASTTIRSGIIFSTDSAILFRSGGNATRVAILKNGDMGIGTAVPAASLDVNGDFKLGAIGTVLANVLKVTVNTNLPPVNAGATLTLTFNIPNVVVGATAMISPGGAINAGMVIGSVRASALNTIEVRFINTTALSIDLAAMDYFIVVIQ